VRGGDPTRAQRSVDAAGTQVMRRTGVVPATVPAGPNRAPRAVPVRPDQVYRRTDYAEPPRGGRTGWWVAGIIGIVALLVVGGLVVYNLTRDDDPPALAIVEVPDVVGQAQADAERILREADLVPVVVAEESTTVPEGTVISQDPAAGGSLDEGSNVTINVSAGTTQLQLPNLVGGTEQQAREALAGLGLPDPEVTPEESADQPAGTVLAQDPPEGLVPAGTVVKLTVSSGVGKVVIPNVVNLDAVQATAQLTSAELVVASTQEPSDSVPAGKVIRTEPGVGEEVDKGSTVTLVVSTGAAPVPVPDVVGMTESAARDALQQAGFLQQVVRIDVPFDSPQAGQVISQNPTAGTEYGKGQTVTINVGQAQPAPTTTTSSTSPPASSTTTTVGTTTTT
jgi:beta-lactam-binding protein with PASTA domain